MIYYFILYSFIFFNEKKIVLFLSLCRETCLLFNISYPHVSFVSENILNNLSVSLIKGDFGSMNDKFPARKRNL